MPEAFSHPEAVYITGCRPQRAEQPQPRPARDVSLPQNRFNGNVNATPSASTSSLPSLNSKPLSSRPPQGFVTTVGGATGVTAVKQERGSGEASTSSASHPEPSRPARQAPEQRRRRQGPAQEESVPLAATIVSKRMLMIGLVFLPMVWLVHIMCFAPMVWPNRCRLLKYDPPLKVRWEPSTQRALIKRGMY